MPAAEAYQYALWRLVADLERGEAFNVGVIVYCRRRGYLEARAYVDAGRAAALAPGLDPRWVGFHLDGLVRIAAGEKDAGQVAVLPQSERFHWLVAPASTILQPGPVHTGLCADPAELLQRLFTRLVR